MSMLNNALSGLQASQYALNVVSQNVANMNTDGYSRQQAIMAARTTSSFSGADGGVDVTAVQRISDSYVNAALWRAQSDNGYDNERATLFDQVSSVLGSDSLNINNSLDDFYAALNAASESPADIAIRQEVIAAAGSLSEQFQQITGQLQVQTSQADDAAQATVTNINTAAANIARLNEKIVTIQAKGGDTAALADQRDNEVLSLSQYVSVATQPQHDGSYTVTLDNGQPLVMGHQSGTMALTDNQLTVAFGNELFQAHDVGGSLGANRDYLNNELADYQQQLDQLAGDIGEQINSQLQNGFDLNGEAGQALFVFDSTAPASTLSVNPDLGAEQLAFTGSDDNGLPAGGTGNNDNLLQMLDMGDDFYNDYSHLISGVAVSSGQAQTQATASATMLDNATARRDSISGVNQDEEAASLMSYSQSYQANAQVISTADRLFNTLLGMF